MKLLILVSFFSVFIAVVFSQNRFFDFGGAASNFIGAAVNSVIGRDCRGRPQGDYFYGCQCIGPLNIGRKKRSPQGTRFLNSNQGLGGDFIRCSIGSFLGRNGK
ncbi:uncharacterized protein LOC111698937 [Eurytemora carolleeae]|uniref:uncharacterized protein LOC111698937 n=1 Tax=Eurytemora carolleeae TaxID=1294199 RepID=UPI000C777F6B|nr:uncharacterized protein LOC111698937 [Eurytemora carolleeae]|eukprot:XP_023325188.1 uncharacterized protein LOC111698937 [Eurytemora affinis]